MPKMLADAGYATGMYGKWHLGQTKGRFPTDQGFDESYGIPNSSDEAAWLDDPRVSPGFAPVRQTRARHGRPQGRRGEGGFNFYDRKERTLIDKDLTDKSIDFMQRQVKAGKPFFLYLPYAQVHTPTLPHPDFKGKTRNGDFTDMLSQTDAYVGRLLDEVDRLGVRDDTIFIFTSDNGAEPLAPDNGFSRTMAQAPCSRVLKARCASAVHHSLARQGSCGRGEQRDRTRDGPVPDLGPHRRRQGAAGPRHRRRGPGFDFLLGKKEKSNRESVVIYNGNDIYGVKWRNWKMMTKEIASGVGQPVEVYPGPALLRSSTPTPRRSIRWIGGGENTSMRWPAGQVLVDHLASLKKEPPIRPGTPDPYTPPKP